MLAGEEAWQVRNDAEQICSASEIAAAVRRIAAAVTVQLSQRCPLVMSVLGGAVIFTGHLLPLLDFPLEFDYVHVTRYGDRTTGEQLAWKMPPGENVRGRVVLVLDDILDEGFTLAAIRDKVLQGGAQAFFSAVLVDKDIGRAKPIQPDFVGLTVPNRYVFGFGMDVRGAWRNLPAIYALR
ncbi:MAG: hypoxanthine-guanine phosphoribosyltransferase [Burkholderiales bacterium]